MRWGHFALVLPMIVACGDDTGPAIDAPQILDGGSDDGPRCSQLPPRLGDARFVDASSPDAPCFGAAEASDLGPTACGDGGGAITLMPAAVPLTSVEAVDDPARLASGRAIRLRLSYPLHAGCEYEMPPTVVFNGALARVGAWVLRPPSGCSGTPRAASRIVMLWTEVGGDVFVVDSAATVWTPLVTLHVACGVPFDGRTVPLGGACDNDAQCRAAFCLGMEQPACLPTASGATVCALACERDADCPLDRPRCGRDGDGVPSVCVPATGDGCTSDADCRFAERCTLVGAYRSCRRGQWRGSPPAQCSCATECGFGSVCIVGYAPNACAGGASPCAMPCRDARDCWGNGFERSMCLGGFCGCITD